MPGLLGKVQSQYTIVKCFQRITFSQWAPCPWDLREVSVRTALLLHASMSLEISTWTGHVSNLREMCERTIGDVPYHALAPSRTGSIPSPRGPPSRTATFRCMFECPRIPASARAELSAAQMAYHPRQPTSCAAIKRCLPVGSRVGHYSTYSTARLLISALLRNTSSPASQRDRIPGWLQGA